MPNYILALAMLMGFLSLYILSKGKSDEYGAEIKEYRFIFAFLASLGLYLNERIPWPGPGADGQGRTIRQSLGMSLGYNAFRQAEDGLTELFGREAAYKFLMVHRAQKTVLALVMILTIGFFTSLGKADSSSWLGGIILAILAFYWPDYLLGKKVQERKRKILVDLPVFLNTVVLLMNAGLPFSAAVERIVRERDADRPLYKELGQVLAQLKTGIPVYRAYEDLALRCKMPEITRLVTAIQQNLSRGGDSMVYVLTDLSSQAWESRKDTARKLGEEASTKLIFPMVMIFAAIAMIVLAPAISAMAR